MKNNIVKLSIVLIVAQIVSYSLIGEWSMENRLLNNFKIFNERRNINEWNINKNEEYYFASCGDEYFRGLYGKEKFLKKVISNYNNIDSTNYYTNINYLNYYDDKYEILKIQTNDNENLTCIFFEVCKLKKIPMFYNRIMQTEIFSSAYDLHGMMYNEMIVYRDLHYIWFLGFWIKVHENTSDY